MNKSLKPYYERGGIKSGYFSIMGGLGWVMPFVVYNLPPHTKRVELTCGRGELIWHTTPAQTEILNDKDEMLIRVHRTVQSMTERDLRLLGEFDWTLNRVRYESFRLSEPPTDDLEFVFRLLYLFAGGRKGDELFKDVFQPTNEGKIPKTVASIRRCLPRMKAVIFTNMDATDLFREVNGEPDTFVFIDPPYPSRERYYRIHDLDWASMCELLRQAKCKWMLVSDVTLSPRVGTAIRNPARIAYIMQGHGELKRLIQEFDHRIMRQDFKMDSLYSNLSFASRCKEYAIVTNFSLREPPRQGVLL